MYSISPRFRIVAIADSASASASGPTAKWLNAQLLSLFVFHTLPTMSAADELALIQRVVSNLHLPAAEQLIGVVEKLRASHDSNVRITSTSYILFAILITFSCVMWASRYRYGVL